MTIDKDNLINFYTGLANEEESADEIKRGISEDLKSYAENLDISPKAIKAGYKLFKKYHNGKETQNDIDETTEIENIVIENFVSNLENN